jgi:thioredoxin 1
MEAVTLAQIERTSGPFLLEFGAEWCGYCRAAQPLIETALSKHPKVRHIRIEDGKGKRLGRQYGVKLWPSLIFISDGKEISRLVRPHDAGLIDRHLFELEQSSPDGNSHQ